MPKRIVIGVLIGLLIGSAGTWAAPSYLINVWEFRAYNPSIRDAYVAGISDTFDAISRWGQGFPDAFVRGTVDSIARCLARHGRLGDLRAPLIAPWRSLRDCATKSSAGWTLAPWAF